MLSEAEIERALVYLQLHLRDRTPPRIASRTADNALTSLIDRVIPAHPAYNRQRFYAVDTLDAWDPAKTDMDEIVAAIGDRRPHFREPVASKWVVSLSAALKRYDGLRRRHGDAIPERATLAIRHDETTLSRDQDVALLRSPAQRAYGDVRKRIEGLFNQVVPNGAFFNPLRRFLLDEVTANNKLIMNWADRDARIARQKSDHFIANEAHHDMTALVATLEQECRDWRVVIRPGAALLDAQAAHDIRDCLRDCKDMMAEEARAKCPRLDIGARRDAAPVAGLRGLVRIAYASANTASPLDATHHPDTVAHAAVIAKRLDAIVMPNPSNLQFRTIVAESILQHTDAYRTYGCFPDAGMVYPDDLAARIARIRKPSALRALTDDVAAYLGAWATHERLGLAPVAPDSAAAPAPDVAPLGDTRRQAARLPALSLGSGAADTIATRTRPAKRSRDVR